MTQKEFENQILENGYGIGSTATVLGPDHVQVNWKHKSIRNISQLETRLLIG